MAAEDIGVEGQHGGGHVLHFGRAGNADPGVVDQHVDRAAVDPHRLGDAALDLFVGQHVDLDDMEVQTLARRKAAQLLGLGAGEAAHGREDPRPGARVMLGAKPAEAGGTARDEDGFARQIRRGSDHIALSARSGGGEDGGGGGAGEQRAAGQIGHANLLCCRGTYHLIPAFEAQNCS